MGYSEWTTAFSDSVSHLIQRVIAYLPNLLGAMVLLVLGWLLACLARAAIARLTTSGLAVLSRNTAIGRALERTALRERIPKVVGVMTYWVIVLFFVAAAVERLELRVVTTLISGLAYYLPKVLMGVVIVFAGFVAGNIAHSAISTAASTAGVSHASGLGRAAQILITFVGFVMGAEYLGIQSTFLIVIAAIAVFTTLGGAALAFGLGSGVAVSNIISAHYLLKTYEVGQTVRISGLEGRIVEISQTGVILDAAEGRIIVPAKKFSEEASVLVKGEA